MKEYQFDDTNEQKNKVNEPDAGYKKAERDLLIAGLKRSYTERFEVMMRLIKISIMFKNARITTPGDASKTPE